MSAPDLNGLSPAKRALYEVRSARTRSEAHERAAIEPIAVVGVGLRFPGGACDASSYWRLLEAGVDAVGPIPTDRWDIERYYDADPDASGKMYTRNGGFIENHDSMDAPFFGVSPLEAKFIDPQHRVLLETAWEAIEDSGQDPQKLAGTAAGVFFALSNCDYMRLASRDPEAFGPYSSTGTNYSVAAGRLSFILGLTGPSMVVDSACSGSLVAVHLACRSLRAGECRVAIAGGVNLILSPDVNINFCAARMLAPDGRCKTFDESADGYVRSEGCGVVVLKRVSDAQVNGDRVLAIIPGSAVNQDGRSSGLTVPCGPAQEAVLRRALGEARLSPADIDYVEAHGTGTKLGDPIEAHALAAVFSPARTRPLVVASVKTNLGHLEAAAGIAGLIKVILALQNECIPPHLHFRAMNPHIDWAGTPVEIPVCRRPWPRNDRPRRAGVSSFGFSGTNAHIIVEEPPVSAEPMRHVRQVQLLPLSARTEAALEELTRRYTRHDLDVDLSDLCYTAAVGRAHFGERAVYLTQSREELHQKLNKRHAAARGRVGAAPKVAFLFTGQGTQYPQMGRRLYDAEPVFRAVIDECGVYDVLYGSATDLLNQTEHTQPALFALQSALTALWRSWGVEPTAVLGHSVGEYAAACAAGIISVADGLRLITARGRLTGGLPTGEGAMVVILAPSEEVRLAVARYPETVGIAAFNGPENVVISGLLREVEQVADQFAERGHRVERLRVSHAFHSPVMEAASRRFAAEVRAARFQPPNVHFVSTVLGREARFEEISEPEYWRRQVRDSVLFERAMEEVKDCDVMVEIGPGSTLLGMGRDLIGNDTRLWLPSIRRSRSDAEQMAESLAELYVRGLPIDWAGYYQGRGCRRCVAPTYPFQRQRFWFSAVPEGPSPDDIWNAVSERSHYQSGQGRLDLDIASYERRWSELAELSSAYIRAALYDLGAYRIAGESHTPQSLHAACGIKNEYARLIRRWLDRLTADGVLDRVNDLFLARQPLDRPEIAALLERAATVFGSDRVFLEYVTACGSQLAAVLTGAMSPLETLFPDGDFARAEDLYERSPLSAYFSSIARAALDAIARCRRAGLRVLEIGAGTGATTSALLPVLTGTSAEYVFTDVSEIFLRHAATKFSSCSFLSTRLLDIEQPQGPRGWFDVVVATNVLHATRDLDRTLNNVRALLAPAGYLILCEATTYLPWFDVTTGLIEGWQQFDDGWRGDHPLLRTADWIRALEAAGFARSFALPEQHMPAAILGQHVIIAENTGTGSSSQPPEKSNHVLIAVDEQDDSLLAVLSSSPASERRELLLDVVCKELAAVLGVADPETLDRRRRLIDLGIDSLMAIQIRARLGKALRLERPLPATLVFDHPTIEALSRFLETGILGFHEPTSDAAPAISALARRIQSMSEAEAEALLLEQLGPSRPTS